MRRALPALRPSSRLNIKSRQTLLTNFKDVLSWCLFRNTDIIFGNTVHQTLEMWGGDHGAEAHVNGYTDHGTAVDELRDICMGGGCNIDHRGALSV